MKFEISKKKVEYSNQFVVHIDTVGGDGDDYNSFAVPGFRKDSEESMSLLENLVLTLQRMSTAPMNDQGNYKDVEGFNRWFDTHEWDEKDPKYSERLFDKEFSGHYSWPCDSQEWDFNYSLERYVIYYYNEDGVRFEVKY